MPERENKSSIIENVRFVHIESWHCFLGVGGHIVKKYSEVEVRIKVYSYSIALLFL